MNDSRDPMGTDGWLSHDEPERPDTHNSAFELHGPPERPLVRTRTYAQPDPDPEIPDVAQGKMMAVFGYASLLFGLPVFVIPMFTRDNVFALHHAKAAGASFVGFMLAAILTLFTCGLTFPLMLLFYIPALIGAVQAANGQLAGPWAMGEFGERLFANIRVKEHKRLP